MKTIKELADIGAGAAELMLPTSSLLTIKDHNGWNYKGDEPARQAFAAAVKEAVLADLVTKSDWSPTFEAHGFTWNRHTPGDPMPCDGRTHIDILDKSGSVYRDRPAHYHDADYWTTEYWNPIIGWRYAEPTPSATKTVPLPPVPLPPVTKTVPLTMDDIRATDEFKSKSAHVIETADYWCDNEVGLAWSGDTPTYAALATYYLRRQHDSTEWKPCTKEVAV